MNSLPKTVTRQGRDCDLNLGPSAPESSTLTTRLSSHAIRPSTFIFIRTANFCGTRLAQHHGARLSRCGVCGVVLVGDGAAASRKLENC